MIHDLVIRNARVTGHAAAVDIAVSGGRIAAIGPKLAREAVETVDADHRFACGGFIDAHVHLDKACILDRCRICDGTLAEAVAETARAKAGFSEADVYRRAAMVVEKAICHGTMHMRSFVEVDPRTELRSFVALKRLRDDFRFAIDIELGAFAQEGLTNEPETMNFLKAALDNGADFVGGCPYTDPNPAAHIALIFDLAEQYGVPVDFHLDFDLEPSRSNLPTVIEETVCRNYQGRVSIGHVTSLSALSPERVDTIAMQLASAGIALTVLPATDLFLLGRDRPFLIPRGIAPALRLAQQGVTAAIATNNVLNPFTPFGDASLSRMANLYANVAHVSRQEDLDLVFGMITHSAASLMGIEYGLSVGAPADIVLFDAPDAAAIVREIMRPLAGWKHGRKSFDNGRSVILRLGLESRDAV